MSSTPGGERRLYTDFLDYDLDNEIAHYFNKGKLVDSTNTLTSKTGGTSILKKSTPYFGPMWC